MSASCSTTAARSTSTSGKPLPGAIEETVRNLREIAPTWYFTVPKGYEALLPYLPRRRRAAREFLQPPQGAVVRRRRPGAARLRRDGRSWRSRPAASASCSSPASARPRPRPLRSAARGTRDHAGQYRPAAARRRAQARAGREGKLEARLRGPNITPGYWRDAGADGRGVRRGRLLPARRRAALRRSGAIPARACCSTAASPRISSSRPAPGSASGRCAPRCIAHFAPFVRDVVIAGPDRDDHRRAGLSRSRCLPAPRAAISRDGRDRRRVARASGACGASSAFLLDSFAQPGTGIVEPRRAARCCSTRPPSLDAGEITDKGSINQRAVLRHRAALVEELYADGPPPASSRSTRGDP